MYSNFCRKNIHIIIQSSLGKLAVCEPLLL